MALQDRGEGGGAHPAGAGALALAGDLEEALLGRPEARGREVGELRGVSGAAQREHELRAEGAVDRVGQRIEVGALAEAVGGGAEQVAAVEVRAALLQVADRADHVGVAREARRAAGPEELADRVAVELELLRPRRPLGPPAVGVDAVVLRIAGAVGGDLGRPGAADAADREGLLDLRPAAREVLDHRPLDPLDVGVAVAGRAPLDPQLAHELGPELGLEDVAGGLGVLIEGGAAPGGGEREPGAVARGFGQVGDEDVGVEGGVAGTAHAMAEGHGDEAGAGLDHLAAAAALHEAGLALEVADPGGDGAVVGGEDRLAGLRVAEGVDQRDRLGGGEADVVASTGCLVRSRPAASTKMRVGGRLTRTARLCGSRPSRIAA
jgi:hypothetical protein